MKNPLGGGNGMVPHYSGTTLDAQARYANGTKNILENYLSGKPQEVQNIIVGLGPSSSLFSPGCPLNLSFSSKKANMKLAPVSDVIGYLLTCLICVQTANAERIFREYRTGLIFAHDIFSLHNVNVLSP